LQPCERFSRTRLADGRLEQHARLQGSGWFATRRQVIVLRRDVESFTPVEGGALVLNERG
jgi:hypothetical protein